MTLSHNFTTVTLLFFRRSFKADARVQARTSPFGKLLKWSSWGTVHSAGYYGNGAVGVLCVVQDIIEMEQMRYCVWCRILLKRRGWGTVFSAGYY